MSAKLGSKKNGDDGLKNENWGEFAMKFVANPSLIKFADEVGELENIQTEEVGSAGDSGGYQRFDRGGGRFDGPPRGGDRSGDRGARPPYGGRNDSFRDGPDAKRPAYNDRSFRGNDGYNDRRGGPDYRNDERRGPDYRNDERRGPDFRDGDRRGPDYRDGDRRGPDFRDGDRRGSDFRDGDRRGPDYRNDDRRGPDFRDGDRRGPDFRDGDRRGPDSRFDDRRGPDNRYEERRGPDGGRFDDRRGGDRPQYGNRPPYGGGDRGGFSANPPSKSIRVSALSYEQDENEFKDWVQHSLAGVRSTGVNFIRDRDTRAFKGFAFINFDTIEDAQAGLDALKSAPPLGDGRCRIDFSNSDRSRGMAPRRD
ncbi:RRM domain protein [Pseudoloma neurophilia]|uniref:RRM domain protein n=1 Tax=Pseudoloma neurophilia TaxID=146866 RepID=A0A0R0M0D7_9MICR|nr:RRM domain protein [Pseudoloma neurophilia]